MSVIFHDRRKINVRLHAHGRTKERTEVKRSDVIGAFKFKPSLLNDVYVNVPITSLDYPSLRSFVLPRGHNNLEMLL